MVVDWTLLFGVVVGVEKSVVVVVLMVLVVAYEEEGAVMLVRVVFTVGMLE